MATIYFDDRWIIRSIGTELQNILEVNGAQYALSYLKQCILRSALSESPIFLRGVSRLQSVKKLLRMVSPEESEPIKKILEGGNNDNRTGAKNGKGTD
jgi:hypothetical protein